MTVAEAVVDEFRFTARLGDSLFEQRTSAPALVEDGSTDRKMDAFVVCEYRWFGVEGAEH